MKRKALAESAKLLTRTITVSFDEDNTLSLTIRPLAVDEADLKRRAEELEKSGDEDAARQYLAELLSETIESWDMEDEDEDGNAIFPEPDAEYILTFSTLELNVLMHGIQEAQGGPTGETSGSSKSSPVTSARKSRRN